MPLMDKHRPVRVIRTVRTDEGVEEVVRRAFPQEQLPHLDPFLLFDDAGPELSAGNAHAAGWVEHPHYGLVALTYVVGGIPWEGIDMQGIYNRQDVGSVSWLSTGGGAVHIERPMEPVLSDGGWAHSIQVWLKIPNSEMNEAPRHIYVAPDNVAQVNVHGANVRVLAGDAFGVSSPVHATTPILYLHISTGDRTPLPLDIATDWNVAIWPIAGSIAVGDSVIDPDFYAVCPPAPGSLTVSGMTEGSEVLVLAAPPQGEPFVRIGPFCAPDERTIGWCFDSWKSGRFGRVPDDLAVAKPWTGTMERA
jgi:quercetin 2,3-dioxygenase